MIIWRRVVRRPAPPHWPSYLIRANLKDKNRDRAHVVREVKDLAKAWAIKGRKEKWKMAYDGFTDEYRIVAYFRDTYPSPTTYKRRTYKTLEDAEREFPEALKHYREKPYAKHLESVSIECRQVGPWRWIGD